MPQQGKNWADVEPAIHSVYHRRLGNMVLLSQTTNHSIGNDSFADKKMAYEEFGGLVMPPEVRVIVRIEGMPDRECRDGGG